MVKRIPVAILGAAGSVGQRFVQLLDQHPIFEVTALAGSDRKSGQYYGESCHWILSDPMPEWAKNIKMSSSIPELLQVPLAFSALPADIASEIEPQFANAGTMICSNASSFRRAPDVPILLPEVNADHANLVEVQRRKRGWNGGIITNPNCTSTGMTIALKPLQDTFGVLRVFAVSMQAVSGAGYPGVPSLDILDNVIPYIGGEEEKVEYEPLKMLGCLKNDAVLPADFVISSHTNRVAVSDGHTLCLSIELANKTSPEDAAEVLQSYQAPQISQNLPSTPQPIIILKQEADRPQPRLDRMSGKGMSTVVGRLRKDPIFDLKLVVLSHNTIRGAAGGSIYNAELLVKMGLIQ